MLTKLDDYKPTPTNWLIPGILGNALTVLSGEPKVGKSLLASHVVSSLLDTTPFLGRVPEVFQHKIAWMGFDSNWTDELKERIPNNYGRLYLASSSGYKEIEKWKNLIRELCEGKFSLLVIDHLYGIADGLDLNNHNEVDQAMKPIMESVNDAHIPVLLIAHAGKQSFGRAAHSIAIEGKTRQLLRLSNSAKKSKLLQIKGNRNGDESFKFHLDLDGCRLNAERNEKVRERTGISLENTYRLLTEAPLEALKNNSSAGRWFYQVGISSSADAGRALVGRLLKMGLLTAPNGQISVISKGPKMK